VTCRPPTTRSTTGAWPRRCGWAAAPTHARVGRRQSARGAASGIGGSLPPHPPPSGRASAVPRGPLVSTGACVETVWATRVAKRGRAPPSPSLVPPSRPTGRTAPPTPHQRRPGCAPTAPHPSRHPPLPRRRRPAPSPTAAARCRGRPPPSARIAPAARGDRRAAQGAAAGGPTRCRRRPRSTRPPPPPPPPPRRRRAAVGRDGGGRSRTSCGTPRRADDGAPPPRRRQPPPAASCARAAARRGGAGRRRRRARPPPPPAPPPPHPPREPPRRRPRPARCAHAHAGRRHGHPHRPAAGPRGPRRRDWRRPNKKRRTAVGCWAPNSLQLFGPGNRRTSTNLLGDLFGQQSHNRMRFCSVMLFSTLE